MLVFSVYKTSFFSVVQLKQNKTKKYKFKGVHFQKRRKGRIVRDESVESFPYIT